MREAKTHQSRLIERVEAGEEFIIAKVGRPAARLVPIERARKPVWIGGLKARVPLPEDLDGFEGPGALEVPQARFRAMGRNERGSGFPRP